LEYCESCDDTQGRETLHRNTGLDVKDYCHKIGLAESMEFKGLLVLV
jgi:hypothetical protein